jgi:predicted protein tyrosine phosphatase
MVKNITICGVDELHKHRHAGVDYLLSILSPEEFETHKEAWSGFYGVKHQAIMFDDVAMPGPRACSVENIKSLLTLGDCLRAEPDSHLLVHCHAGVSRSTAAAVVLMCQREPGTEKAAFMRLAELRPQARPNIHVIQLADEVLGRNGALMDGLDVWQAWRATNG